MVSENTKTQKTKIQKKMVYENILGSYSLPLYCQESCNISLIQLNISFAVSKLSQFMHKPPIAHTKQQQNESLDIFKELFILPFSTII